MGHASDSEKDRLTARALARNVGEGVLHLAFRGGNVLPLVRTTGAFANPNCFPQKQYDASITPLQQVHTVFVCECRPFKVCCEKGH